MKTMMFGQLIAIVLVTILSLVGAQDTTPSVCSTGCVNGVFVNAANLGCANGDTLCVCGKTDSFRDGIRDCIIQACPADGPDAQIPLADAYADAICASAAASSSTPPPAPTSSTAPASTEPQPTNTEAASATTSTGADSTATSIPSAESSSQSTVASSTVTSTETSSSASNTKVTTAPISGTPSDKVSSSVSTSISSPSTTSSSLQPIATSGTSQDTTGLSTAVKAGIGAGVGAAALAAIIITVCVCLRRRQRNKTVNRVRNYKISEPMAVSDRQFGNDVGRAEAGLPKPIITTLPVRADAMAMATSPTSLYSNSSDLETHARRYEDMMPRTQPRTMI
ncbi:hypothetical protein F5Y12DRAFT_683754 [Xylaria sp. FL1777]|nr:hypothetical protein F5Y12DRAFT_683754 [Xylaria sp. FL1777]